MPFRIVVEEATTEDFQASSDGDATGIRRYQQVVDEIDLKRVMEAVNWKPRGPRKAKKGAEA